MRILSFIFIFTIYSLLNGQTLVKPGDSLIRYNSLGTFNLKYKTQLIDPSGNVKYESITEKNTFVNRKLNQFIVVQSKSAMNDKIVDSTIADLKTLTPIRMRMTSGSKKNEMDLTFNGAAIHAKVDRMNNKKDTIHFINEPYFDSNLLELILGLIKYEKDSTFKINTYTYELGGLDSYIIKKIGKESLDLKDAPKTDVWHIIIYQESSLKRGNKQGFEFWIACNWGIVVKEVISFGTNKGKYVISLNQD